MNDLIKKYNGKVRGKADVVDDEILVPLVDGLKRNLAKKSSDGKIKTKVKLYLYCLMFFNWPFPVSF